MCQKSVAGGMVSDIPATFARKSSNKDISLDQIFNIFKISLKYLVNLEMGWVMQTKLFMFLLLS